MIFAYPAIVHLDDDGIWLEFPDLVGCTTFGDSIEEVYDNAIEAMEVYILSALENNIALNKSTDIKVLKKSIDDKSFITFIKANVE